MCECVCPGTGEKSKLAGEHLGLAGVTQRVALWPVPQEGVASSQDLGSAPPWKRSWMVKGPFSHSGPSIPDVFTVLLPLALSPQNHPANASSQDHRYCVYGLDLGPSSAMSPKWKRQGLSTVASPVCPKGT